MKKNKLTAVMGLALSAMVAVSPLADVQGALNIPISRAVTVEAVVTGTNVLNISLLNTSDDQAAAKMIFANTSAIGKASQYLQVDFNSNAVGARVVLRTDNKNSTKPFTGTGEGAGLVGNTDSKVTVPLLWAVFDDLAPAKAFVFKGDTDASGTAKGSLPGAVERGAGEAEGLVVDKANTNYENADPSGANVQGYATVVLPQGTTGLLGNFPSDEDGAGPKTGLRPCTSPIFVVVAGAFGGLTAQTYSSSTLALDLVTQ